jgi:hypothetical protein
VFDNDEFDLALSSHFRFTYSERLSTDFHVASVEEMCQVADEVCVSLLQY